MVAMAVISGILTDIYRRFGNLSKYTESVIRLEEAHKEHKDDIKEIKDDIKYLVKKEIDRSK